MGLVKILFYVLLVLIFGRLMVFSIRLTWSITKVLLILIFLPLILIGAVIAGLISLALPALIVIGIISLIRVK